MTSGLSKDVKNITLDSLHPSSPRGIVSIHGGAPLIDALQLMLTHSIQSLPVKDWHKDVYTSFIDLVDVVAVVARKFQQSPNAQNVPLRELLTESVSEVVNLSKRNEFAPVDMRTTVQTGLEMVVRKGLHRLPVVAADQELSTVVTQSRLVRFMFENKLGLDAALLNRTLADLQPGSAPVVTLLDSAPTWAAFALMHGKHISGIAVVDASGALVGNVSASDVRSLDTPDSLATVLFEPVSSYVDRMPHFADPTALALSPSSTFDDLLSLVAKNALHRVYILDQDKKPTRVVSLVDILSIILNSFS